MPVTAAISVYWWLVKHANSKQAECIAKSRNAKHKTWIDWICGEYFHFRHMCNAFVFIFSSFFFFFGAYQVSNRCWYYSIHRLILSVSSASIRACYPFVLSAYRKLCYLSSDTKLPSRNDFRLWMPILTLFIIIGLWQWSANGFWIITIIIIRLK